MSIPIPRQNRSTRLNLRATPRQKELFATAAAKEGVSVTRFVLDSAAGRAEELLAEERRFKIPAERWNDFLAMLDRPARSLPRLRKLMRKPSVLERR